MNLQEIKMRIRQNDKYQSFNTYADQPFMVRYYYDFLNAVFIFLFLL